MKIHKVVTYERGPKDKRVRMVQASFTDETGHHTNHFSEVEWERKVAATKPEDSGSGVESADVG
jgi:hypothetical protein